MATKYRESKGRERVPHRLGLVPAACPMRSPARRAMWRRRAILVPLRGLNVVRDAPRNTTNPQPRGET
jgi:hypothetical protein